MKLPTKEGNSWCHNFVLSAHKNFEIQFDWRTPEIDLFRIDFQIRRKGDHAGAHLFFSLFEICYLTLMFYDSRHWNYEEDRWCEYGESHDE